MGRKTVIRYRLHNQERNEESLMAAIEEERAVWTTAFIDDLADSAFLYIEHGGTKDGEGQVDQRQP